MFFLNYFSAKKRDFAVAILIPLLLAVVLCSFSACKENNPDTESNPNTNTTEYNENNPSLVDAKISKDAKFGAANIDVSIDEFNELGFSLGDSCDISFSNGYKLTDVPYFNGYYVKNASPVIVAYPSNEYVLITLNNNGIWDDANLDENCTVTVVLNAKGKYAATQEALGQNYSLDRSKYESDEEFANFRAIGGGRLKENFIYRGASPLDNSRKRASYTDKLLSESAIAYIVDLADSESDVEKYLSEQDFASAYTKNLYDNGEIVLLSMSSSYASIAYKQSVVKGFESMLDASGPYYVHCMEGKDRTGFVCALIEALAGASYDEMRVDYMTTYKNYYKITESDSPEKYDAIVKLYFDSFMECIGGATDENSLKTADYATGAKNYLKSGGMSDENIEKFLNLITECS